MLGLEKTNTWDNPYVARSVAQLACVGLAACLAAGLYATDERAGPVILRASTRTVDVAKRVLTALRSPLKDSPASATFDRLEHATGALAQQLRTAVDDHLTAALPVIVELLREVASAFDGRVEAQTSVLSEAAEPMDRPWAYTIPALLAPFAEVTAQLARASSIAHSWNRAGVTSAPALNRNAKCTVLLSNDAVMGLALALEVVLGQRAVALPARDAAVALELASMMTRLSRELATLVDRLSGNDARDSCSSEVGSVFAVNGVLPEIADVAADIANVLRGVNARRVSRVYGRDETRAAAVHQAAFVSAHDSSDVGRPMLTPTVAADTTDPPSPMVMPSGSDSARIQRDIETKVLQSWLASAAVVCWLAWFGHPVVDGAPLPSLDATATAATRSCPCALLTSGGCGGIIGEVPATMDGTGGDDDSSVRSSTRTVPSLAFEGGSGSSGGRSCDCASSALSFLCEPTPDSSDDIFPIYAAVTLEQFNRELDQHLEGVMPALACAYEHRAYAVKGCGVVARPRGSGPEAPTDHVPSTLCEPSPHPPAESRLSAALPGSSVQQRAQVGGNPEGTLEMPAEVFSQDGVCKLLEKHADAGWIVPLTLFDRFVRTCAEPSAQATWHLQARVAVHAAVEAAFNEALAQGVCQPVLRDLLMSGRFASSVASTASAALLPFSTAVVASAYSSFDHGGCAGAWAGFLPRQQAEEYLRVQTALEGGPGAFLLRLSSSRACEIVMSYTAHDTHAGGGCSGADCDGVDGVACSGGVRVFHEFLPLSRTGDGYELRGVIYPTPALAVCASHAFLKSPCVAASMAVVGWAPRTTTTPAAPAGEETLSPFPSAPRPCSGLVESAAAEAHMLLQASAGALPFTHVGTGLPFLAYALYGRDLACLPTSWALAGPLVQFLSTYGNERSASSCFAPDALDRMRNAATHAVRVSHVLPKAVSPAALAATAWTRPLPVASPGIIRVFEDTGSCRSAPHCYAFSGFHAPLSYKQTCARLANKPPGSFLLRSSQGQRSCAVLSFVDAAGTVQQCTIAPDTAAAGTGKVICSGYKFPSLLSVLRAYSQPPPGGAPLLRFPVAPASRHILLRTGRVAADLSGSSTD